MSGNRPPRRGAGSISSRNGAAWSRGGADYRKRREDELASRGPEGQFGRIAPLSVEAVRRAVESQVCPWCGLGPYKVLSLHTHKAHGVDRYELRRQSGLGAKDSICSPDVSTNCRDRLVGRDNFAEMTQKAAFASVQAGAQRLARAAQAAKVKAANSDRYAQVEYMWQAGHSRKEIAKVTGFNPAVVRRILLRAGVDVDGRSRPAALPTAEQRAKANATRRRNAATKAASLRSARLARFQELGSDWAAVDRLEEEWGLARRSVVAYLREAGAALPDGRTDHPRRGPRPDLRKPAVPCRAGDCGRRATRLGLCGMHYQRRRASGR